MYMYHELYLYHSYSDTVELYQYDTWYAISILASL